MSLIEGRKHLCWQLTASKADVPRCYGFALVVQRIPLGNPLLDRPVSGEADRLVCALSGHDRPNASPNTGESFLPKDRKRRMAEAFKSRVGRILVVNKFRSDDVHHGSVSPQSFFPAQTHLIVSVGVTTKAASVMPAPSPATIIPALEVLPSGPATSL